MFKAIKEFLFGKPAEAQAPYKVEAPTIVATGEPPATVVAIVEGAGVVEATAPAKKAPKKTAAKKAPAAKKPRKPKAPK